MPAYWDSTKARILGTAPPITLQPAWRAYREGALLPGDWWRAEKDGCTLGYGLMDTTWGDAEIYVVVAPEHRGTGVGTAILQHLEREARSRGLNYLYNTIDSEHPDRDAVAKWLRGRRFFALESGRLYRCVVHGPRSRKASGELIASTTL
jgi:GNAT superfamily N-acetyltransferase